jgi:hypothetical protein
MNPAEASDEGAAQPSGGVAVLAEVGGESVSNGDAADDAGEQQPKRKRRGFASVTSGEASPASAASPVTPVPTSAVVVGAGQQPAVTVHGAVVGLLGNNPNRGMPTRACCSQLRSPPPVPVIHMRLALMCLEIEPPRFLLFTNATTHGAMPSGRADPPPPPTHTTFASRLPCVVSLPRCCHSACFIVGRQTNNSRPHALSSHSHSLNTTTHTHTHTHEHTRSSSPSQKPRLRQLDWRLRHHHPWPAPVAWHRRLRQQERLRKKRALSAFNHCLCCRFRPRRSLQL